MQLLRCPPEGRRQGISLEERGHESVDKVRTHNDKSLRSRGILGYNSVEIMIDYDYEEL